MFNFHTNHRLLLVTISLVFFVLSVIIALAPAYDLQENNSPLPGMESPSAEVQRGLHIYIREGCVACHTQQVRNIEMDNVWGDRPSMPADYYYSKKRMDVWRQSPSILGSERTGPDLTQVGGRQPSLDWHLLHLYNPRLVVGESVMPAYPWLFEEKMFPGKNDVVVNVPEEYLKDPEKKAVATRDALDLTAYLLSLKQPEIPGATDFIPSRSAKTREGGASASGSDELANGKALYTRTCSPCHQQSGEGLPGAFPPLKDSPIVTDKDPEMLVRIIIQGYDARQQYGAMPPLGNQLSDEEIAAIVNYERNQWGHKADLVEAGLITQIRETIAQENLP